jgi:hypothetical protein
MEPGDVSSCCLFQTWDLMEMVGGQDCFAVACTKSERGLSLGIWWHHYIG